MNQSKLPKLCLFFCPLFFWVVMMSIVLNLLATPKLYAASTQIAVLLTKQADPTPNAAVNDIFLTEITALFKGNKTITYTFYHVDSTNTSNLNAQFLNASNDPNTDLVLVLDNGANQLIGHYPVFPKPTILPLVLNHKFLAYPAKNNQSNVRNLNYISAGIQFKSIITQLREVSSFAYPTLITDFQLPTANQKQITTQLKKSAQELGVSLNILEYSSNIDSLLDQLPPQTDAVLYGILPLAEESEMQALIEAINQKNHLSFSLASEKYVQLGALAGIHSKTDTIRLARRTALNIEDILSGTNASELPITFDTNQQLLLNLETADRIQFSPSFALMDKAIVIRNTKQLSNRKYDLNRIALEIVSSNLTLKTEQLEKGGSDEQVNASRSFLLPQISSKMTYHQRNTSELTRKGLLPETTTDGIVSIRQSLFSDSIWSNYEISKQLNLSASQKLKQTELDSIQSGVTAYLNILRNQTHLSQQLYNLDITQKNYQLAKNRIKVGATNYSDLYRWESELANAKNNLNIAQSALTQSQHQLNQLINRPIDEPFSTSIETLDNPELIMSDQTLIKMIDNPKKLQDLTEYFVHLGLSNSPELKQLEAKLNASKRELKNANRSFWLPELNAVGEYSQNIDESREGGWVSAPKETWLVGAELSLPLYEGGMRGSQSKQSQLTIEKLTYAQLDLKNRVETNIRSQMARIRASYPAIKLSKQAENAAQKNYDLLNESYRSGKLSILELLDAQETLIRAREASLNSVYVFLIDLMNLQRAVGAFDFFLTESENESAKSSIMEALNEDQK